MELVIGLQVINDEFYNTYREQMLPILERYGGGFRYDFKISEVLKSEIGQPINRLFTIHFKDEDTMNEFFSNKEYLDIKQHFFEKSVSSVVEIARHQK